MGGSAWNIPIKGEMMAENKHKICPCPNCGSSSPNGGLGWYVNGKRKRVQVSCRCGVSGPWHEDTGEASDLWNKLHCREVV